MMSSFTHISIKAKLIIFLSVILLSVCAAFSFIFAYYTIELFEDDLQKRGLSEALNLAIESKFGTLTEDKEILKPLLVNKLKNPDILFIEITNNDQHIIASAHRYQPSSASTPRIKQIQSSNINTRRGLFKINGNLTELRYYQITVPIRSTSLIKNTATKVIDETVQLQLDPDSDAPATEIKTIGQIRIGISLHRLEAKIDSVLKFIGIVGLAILLIAIAFAYRLARRALSPLLTMSNIATQIAESDLKNISFANKAMALTDSTNARNLSLVPQSRDEIGLLITAFIKMSSRLQDYGQNLEQQVQRRTKELSLALQQSRVLKSEMETANQLLLMANHQLQLFRRCIEETSDFILITDKEGKTHTCNQAFLNHNGYTAEQVENHHLSTFLAHPEVESYKNIINPVVKDFGKWQGETQFRKKSGEIYPVALSITKVSDDQQTDIAYICIARDITQQQQHQDDLIALASRDTLTGLFNRRRFLEILEQEISRSKRQNNEFALVWLDLDQFKEINDSMGHQAGDDVLIKLAQNLVDITREVDSVARLGGDEFAVLLPDTSHNSARISVERLIDSIRSKLIIIDQKPVRILTSIGISLFPGHANNSHDLLACADIALYKSKQAGRNQFNFFHPADREQEQYSHQQTWSQRLRDALAENRLTLFRQVIVDVNNGQGNHYELLLRMFDEHGKLVMPEAFITAAERTNLIYEIDRWVIHNAMKLYNNSNLKQDQCKVAINLSAKALSDEDFPEFIEAEFSVSGIDPSRFIFEITENSAIADFTKATRFIQRLKLLGCEFALDDFGVGFASFSHLRELDVNYLKIDGSFIREITNNPRDQGIVEAMIKVAQSLNIRTTAEWVENAKTLSLLTEMGIDFVQGNYLGKPEPTTIETKQKH